MEVWRYIDDVFFLWEHGEDKLQEFIENLNKMHSTIKFTTASSKTSINFLDVSVQLKEGKLETDLYVKPTDSHQYLLSSSCHPFHCKKGIPYSQTLRLNRICSSNDFFDKRCNDLELWLIERGHNTKLVHQQVLRGRKFSRDSLLRKKSSKQNSEETKLTFNLTYYPIFSRLKNILSELHILLAPDESHKAVFPDLPVVGFKNNKSLKDH